MALSVRFGTDSARRITNISDPKQASAILKEMAYSLLAEIHDLPRKAIATDWMTKIEDEESEV
jgi:hypothetical protein